MRLFAATAKARSVFRESGRNGWSEVQLDRKTVGIRKGNAWCKARLRSRDKCLTSHPQLHFCTAPLAPSPMLSNEDLANTQALSTARD